MADMIRHPAHYGGEDDPYEVIKVAEAWGFDRDAYLFNVLKYIRRDKENQLEDLKKARFYLDRKISRLEGKRRPECERLSMRARDNQRKREDDPAPLCWGPGQFPAGDIGNEVR